MSPWIAGRVRSRDLVVLAIGVAVANAAVSAAFPHARSYDSLAWEEVARLLEAGENPYTTGYLSWPPLWMQIVAGISWVAERVDISFNVALKVFLAGVQLATAVLLYRLVARGYRRALALTVVGFALNPAVVVLDTIHANFDVLVAFWVVLAIGFLLEYRESSDPLAWLYACGAVGAGILTKTTPLVLIPLLVPGLVAERRARWMGVLLVTVPALLATSVLFVRDPDVIIERVASYSSSPGWFGFTGLLDLAGWNGAADGYESVFRVVLGATLIAAGWWCARRRLSEPDTVRLAVVLTMFVPVLGPGFGPQYVLWFLPAAVLLWVYAGRLERSVLLVAWAVLIVDLMIEYALIRSHGGVFADDFPELSERLSTPGASTVLRLPLFLVLATLLGVVTSTLRHAGRDAAAPGPRAHG